ncbi:MAG: ABC transporter ATP-binding protein [Clostridia bacterium]|nr:ABC transporter ATP-binding protein [Clostridia bacterium]
MIVFDQVTKRYPDTTADVVNQLSLTIHDGEICILVGPSGCGKTTTMKMINKLIPPSSGSILIDGQDIGAIDTIQLRLNIGYIIQDIGLFPHMTVAENIATVPVELGWKKDRISARVDELLDLVELDPKDYRHKKPRELSGGQRQRVGVARALAADPKIMLMDEPFGALDPITRAKLQDEFLKIQAKIKKTIVFVTHDIDEALKMGDRIAVLKAGRVIQYGTPMEILAKPADPFVSELIGGRNSLKMMNLLSCGEVMEKVSGATDFTAATAVSIQATAQDALAEMFRTGNSTVLVLDDQKNVLGLIRLESLLESVSDYGRNN